jgi:hypothetical protein
MRNSQTIRCVNRGLSRLPHERIVSVGGTNPDGTHWKQSQGQTIREIETGAWDYYVQAQWRRDKISVATYFGVKYIKADGDVLHPETLLSLPECP